jgi:peroxiredoxin
LSLLAVSGCSKNEAPPEPTSEVPPTSAAGESALLAKAEIGKEAPGFMLASLDGAAVTLADHKGKIVVLEWFNPGCPFVKQSHGEGQLKGMAKRYQRDGVVWLAINSNKPGSQGSEPEEMREGKESWAMSYPILLDPEGRVGKAYGAERTPHMYVIDAKGTLVYRGAIDNTRGGGAEDVAELVNYVADAIADTKDGKPVRQAETEPWGCTVKYRG